MRRIIWALCFLGLSPCVASDPVEAPLGLPVEISDLYIAGRKVEPVPRTDQSSSLVIRMTDIKEAKDGFRYDFEIYGLDPGTHDLRDHLRTVGTKAVPEVNQKITITVRQPLDTLPSPADLQSEPPQRLGGYRVIMTSIGIMWFAGLMALISYRKKAGKKSDPEDRLPTVGEKLYPLVSKASQGDLSEDEKAKLERLIIGFWKSDLPDLEALPPLQALQRLRSHPLASPLVLKLEEWIHAPNSHLSSTEISELISPYSE